MGCASDMPDHSIDPGSRPRVLITAGPTHEPIDAVRYLGNRSSGRLGISLAEEASARGMSVTLLLGPTSHHPTDSRVRVIRFQTCGELEMLLREHFQVSDVLIMAAAVADYRAKSPPGANIGEGKIRRKDQALVLELEPTPDLLAGCSSRRRAGQYLVGFALEPRDRMEQSAREKLERKGVDLIVANPLETMDSGEIEAALFWRCGESERSEGAIDKSDFARWLLDRIAQRTGLDACVGGLEKGGAR